MNATFRDRLKEARAALSLTQKQVARQLGVVESCYANWEQGRAEPDTATIAKLSAIFDVSTDYLLGLEHDDGSRLPPAGMPAPGFTERERRLLKDFRALNPQEQTQMLAIIRAVKIGGQP
ncbi:MAG: helix-turn-helix domain-containing protein [Clostridiales bacterium]|jgi:transcriptional regulator with XRE-family HTH domain|nr:helix-turn-helix domain-containing protein [Clostridiales bacterium]